MSDLTDVAVGDTLVLIEHYRRGAQPKEVRVTKVGRICLYVGHLKFNRVSGVEADDYGSRQVRTPEQHVEAGELAELLAELRTAGISLATWRTASPLTADALRRILAIVKEDTP
ncbi:hypothetical protein [Streptomyces sp. CBG33]|uniref:beta barrel domain-containing protein n=1 Tax=Streptomyces sp. CBG33 TaxID=2762624 RepID=UPI0016445286|nr:hypothetical protein [Streptomyces sp. CBG33]